MCGRWVKRGERPEINGGEFFSLFFSQFVDEVEI